MSRIAALVEDGNFLHLKGAELVADGCTKPLQGQAFTQFVDDLGLRRTRREHRSAHEDRPAVGGEHHGAAMRAMMIGGVLLSTAEAHSEENDQVFGRIWTAGILLVALGVIYSGQLLFQASRCCLKRMRQCSTRKKNQQRGEIEPEDLDGRPSMRLRSTSRSGSMSSGDGASVRQCMTSQSGSMSIGGSASPRLNMTSHSGSTSMDESASMSLRSRSQSGSMRCGDASMRVNMSPRSGSSSNDRSFFGKGDGSSTKRLTTPSGSAAAADGTTSMNLMRSSGSCSGAAMAWRL